MSYHYSPIIYMTTLLSVVSGKYHDTLSQHLTECLVCSRSPKNICGVRKKWKKMNETKGMVWFISSFHSSVQKPDYWHFTFWRVKKKLRSKSNLKGLTNWFFRHWADLHIMYRNKLLCYKSRAIILNRHISKIIS